MVSLYQGIDYRKNDKKDNHDYNWYENENINNAKILLNELCQRQSAKSIQR